MQIVGMPIVASGTSAGGLITRSSSKRKKKYHAGHGRVLRDRVGEERLPLRLQDRVLAEVLLLLGAVHARSSSGAASATFCQGGAVVPSFATRYRCAPMSAAMAPGTTSMWIE